MLLIRQAQNYFVEVDVVMDATTPLWRAHDVSQQLQDKLEALPNVERAFVHVDHETEHTPVSTFYGFCRAGPNLCDLRNIASFSSYLRLVQCCAYLWKLIHSTP